MKTANFRDFTLTSLDDTFGLAQILAKDCPTWQKWLNLAATIDISAHEKQTLLDLQEPLLWGGQAWNEVELENKFISPVIMTAKIDDRVIGYFLERSLKAIVGDYELSGIVDGMIASGFRDPKMPYFCMHEYKRSVDNSGNPDAQALAAMLVARELNHNQRPIYGLYVVGLIWNFITLDGNKYCISPHYKSDDDELFDLFKMLKAVKQIIRAELPD
jgi:hypothetical protein